MQYVSRFVSSVYNTVTPNINPATLSGAIDVIVVERQVEKEIEVDEDDETASSSHDTARPNASGVGGFGADDGARASGSKSPVPSIASSISRSTSISVESRKRKRKKKVITTELASTPFHVRFGKMSVLRPAERKVTLHLNNASEPLPFAMKVGEAGEAFFVVELDGHDAEQGIPDELVTSPILSAASSPNVHGVPGRAASLAPDSVDLDDASAHHKAPRKLIEEDYVEPLDLGAARSQSPSSSMQASSNFDASETGTIRSGATRSSQDTAATSPSLGDKASPKASEQSVENDEGDSRSRQEKSEGHTFLENVGNAASKASGVIGAAGAAVMPSIAGGRNAKLEKMNKANNLRGKAAGLRQTGAQVDDSKTAHQLDTSQHSKTKERMKRQDDEHPPQDIKDAQNETEVLEIHMRDRARRLVDETLEARKERDLAEREAGKDEPITEDTDANDTEEQYPAPFDARGKTDGTLAYATTQPENEMFLAGRKLKPVRSGLPGRADVDPAQADRRTIEGRLKAWRESHPKADESQAPAPAQSDSLPSDKASKASKYHIDGGRIPTLKASHDEDLHYMLDMDGYKMTADGEDLALAEGGRLAHEIPASHSHDGSIDTDSLAVQGSASKDGSMRASQDDLAVSHETASTSGKTHDSNLAATLDELDASLSESLRIDNGEGVDPQLGNSEDVNLSRDLVRLTKGLHKSQDGTASKSAAADPSERKKLERRQSKADTSQSDTEADRADGAESADEPYKAGQKSQAAARAASHLRATSVGLPSHISVDMLDTPVVRDDAELGLASSTDLEWTWSAKRKGQRRRPRVLSGPDVPDESLLEASEKNDVGHLIADQRDPYEFHLQLGEASHTFSLSLCNTSSTQDEAGQDSSDDSQAEIKLQGIIERFEDNKVSYQRFLDDEHVVNDERLVVRYNDRYLTWENASTVLATLSLYRKTLGSRPGEAPLASAHAGAATTEGSVWRRWWYRNQREEARPAKGAEATPLERANTDSVLDMKAAQQARAETLASDAKDVKPNKVYAKTLRLTSDQLKSLNLRKGANTITFSVTSSYSGVATCTARIFLWESTHQVVVSDIDGTITKSDALGHVFTMIGRDWTHSGVAKLYTDIARNGYRIMYLTSRAIGQADTTRDYLRGITQSNFKLPDGPVIMSPDRLMASLHREVILRKPEVFKMACLRDIARLFGADPRQAQSESKEEWPSVARGSLAAANGPGAGKEQSPGEGTAANMVERSKAHGAQTHVSPFYAGFGNRITDALSYRSVNIPSSRIFTIDSNGEVKMELLELAGYKSSYIHMTDLVDQMFPPISLEVKKRDASKPEFNNFNYWRTEIGEFELPDDEELMSAAVGSSPASPALSARTVRSVRSNESIRSQPGSIRSRDEPVSPGKKAATTDDSTTNASASTSRLSRFGLGKLGLSRRGSSNAGPTSPSTTSVSEKEGISGEVPSAKRSDTVPAYAEGPTAQAARRISPPASPSSPSGSGAAVSSWTASWRRRGSLPAAEERPNAQASSPRASSPLMGPVISADPDGVDDDIDDDDVSSIEEDADDGEAGKGEHGAESRRGQGKRRLTGSTGTAGRSGEDDAFMDDDDPLLATGEIRFEWRG